ncbi:hypothetical protein DPMN_098357 [Dreissena polymorpha]|uniref:Uncharacterized protein n=1 Tax=Dreissena polymorpha TaxID=45954 RepID=A0A9D4LC67_DREPO|nr:hypothetical protein DPMN_098357 [Dreissena polymorpha]
MGLVCSPVLMNHTVEVLALPKKLKAQTSLENKCSHFSIRLLRTFMAFIQRPLNFSILVDISQEFLQLSGTVSSEWESHPEYQDGKSLVQSVKDVNDLAECRVALIQDMNLSFNVGLCCFKSSTQVGHTVAIFTSSCQGQKKIVGTILVFSSGCQVTSYRSKIIKPLLSEHHVMDDWMELS